MKKSIRVIIVFLLFAAAFALRTADLDDPPLDFHPARQMHSALMARAFWMDMGDVLTDKTPEYNAEAYSRGMKEPWIEPPLYEKLTARLYKILGTADLRIPRITSICFWLLGALGLFVLGRRLFGDAGRLAALCWLLFFPYGVIASRSFQPDIPMVCLLIWTVELLCFWAEQPRSLARALAAGLCAGLCILIKQVAAFPIGLAFAFFLIGKFGIKDTLKNPCVWITAVLSLVPMLAYNYWGLYIDGFLKQQYQGRFFLKELLSPSFYVRWFRMIDEVFTIPLALIMIAGLFLLKTKEQRLLWSGYFLGYILYGLCLPHHIGTHNYYQLLLFPAAAIGFGAAADALWRQLSENASRLCSAAACLCLAVLCAWWAADSIMTLHRKDFRAWPERWISLADELEQWEGQIAVIGLMDDYGGGMIYWGLHTPMIWDDNVESLDETEALIKLNTTFWNYHYFVVTNLEKYYQQPRLQQYITEHADLYRQEADYLIYEMKWDREN